MPIKIAGLGTLSDEEWLRRRPNADWHLMHETASGGRLFMGQTPWDDEPYSDDDNRYIPWASDALSERITSEHFDVRFDMYGWGKRAAEGVLQYTMSLGDTDIRTWTGAQIGALSDVVYFAREALDAGERVLINCQAGLNRSGLATALVLMSYGMSASEAIERIHTRRSDLCLVNRSFVEFLHTQGADFVAETLGDN